MSEEVPVDEFDTIEEAIASAWADLDEGGTLTIHQGDCAVEDDGETGCDCTPEVLTKGARA